MNTEKKDTSTQIIALVAALIIAAVMASGCSVAPVQGDTINPNNNAGVSYTNCVNVLTQYGTQQQCYAVGSNTVTSYNGYTTPTVTSYYLTSGAELSKSYEDYLAQVNPEDLAALNAQWDALVAQASK